MPVSDGAQTLAQGATEQASSIEELSTMNDEFHFRWRCKERGQCRSGKRYFNDHRKEPRGKQHADEKTVRSHELDTQAQKLKKLVSVFHLPSQLYSENDDTEN